MNQKLIIRSVISVAVCLLTAFVATVAISTSYDTWYATLEKPDFQIAEWAFTPVWILLFVLIGIGAGIVWSKGFYHKWVQVALYHFGFQLILTAFWFILFFGLQEPLFALLNLIALLILLFITIKWFRIVQNSAAYFLFPYVAWIIYIAIINFEIWRLN